MSSDFNDPKLNRGEYVTLRDYFETRLNSMDKEIAEARRIMENRMAGFPTEFAKKGELSVTAATLKELKDNDLREIKDLCETKLSKSEYDQKHQGLLDRIDSQFNAISDKLEQSAKLYDSRYASLDKRVQDVELMKANVQGRILGTGATIGIVVSLIVIFTQIIIHVYTGK